MRYFLLYSSLSIVLFCTIILVRDNWAYVTGFKLSGESPFCAVPPPEPIAICGVRDDDYHTPYSSVGKALFLSKCASCHNPSMKTRSTGPALAGVANRWAEREKYLYRFIKNGEKFRRTGDAYVNALYNEYGQIPHTIFPKLTNAEIDEILNYIRVR